MKLIFEIAAKGTAPDTRQAYYPHELPEDIKELFEEGFQG
jgi:hypothetical protein